MQIQLIIGAPTSGCGKTLFTMGLLRALRRRTLRVQPYKCGPDYIDTRFHAVASGRTSVNLDTWMAGEEHIRNVYGRYARQAEACVIEGVMGLFDGYNRMEGSTAHIARLLQVPVLLIVDSRSTAYTTAAVLHGMKTFRPDLRIAGVVFNRVASASHGTMLQQACQDVGLDSLGWLPRTEGLEVPSRHLGLTIGKEQEINTLADCAADLVEQCVDIDKLLKKCTLPDAPAADDPQPMADGSLRIAVARDRAFDFCYRENLDRLALSGPVTFFSPLDGDGLPEVDFVYLPGGYPELFASQLAANRRLAGQLKTYVENGGRLLAECGGMMYLSRSMTASDGTTCPMAGVLPLHCTMHDARLKLGYRRISYGGETLYGHEFHYSSVEDPACMPSVAVQYNATGKAVDTPLYRYRNVIAGYTHWYWGNRNLFAWWNVDYQKCYE